MRILDAIDTDQAREQKWQLIGFVSSDNSAALRCGAIRELTYMIRYDRDRSWQLFEQLLAGYDVLLGEYDVREFMYWSLYKNFARWQTYVERMMQHSNPIAQRAGAELVCIAAISENALESDDALAAARSLAEKAIVGLPELRKGATHIYTFNMAHGSEQRVRALCKAKVRQVLNDENEDVRNEVNGIFNSLDERHFFELRDFIEDFALAERHPLNHFFAEYLWKYGSLDPEWTLLIIHMILSKPGKFELWQPGIEELMRFVLRVCTSQTVKGSTHKEAMDTFDELMKQNAGPANTILAEWDRR